MAANRPKKRPSIRAKAFSSMPAANSSTSKTPLSAASKLNKRDKRLQKSTAFLNRIEKLQKKDSRKCRRPNKKLVTTLHSLIDSLPNDDELLQNEICDGDQSKLRLRSLKSRPGVLRRKARLEKDEKARFDMNLVKIAEVGQTAVSAPETLSPIALMKVNLEKNIEPNILPSRTVTTASKFAAIRAWACANLEKHTDFKQNS